MIPQKAIDFFEQSFTEGYSYTIDEATYNFYVINIGLLNIKEGKIIGCDPFLYNEDEPFSCIFPIGTFDVQIAVAKMDNEDERIGFARIYFSNVLPVKWEMALLNGQDITALKEGEIYGYGVDAGTGAYMDITGGQQLSSFLLEKEDNYERLIEEMELTYKHTRSWLLWQKEDSNVAMFSSGWGDGYYASYIGYDANNNICRLVTDFGVLPWDE